MADLKQNMKFLKAAMENSLSQNELKNLVPSIFKLSKQSHANLTLSANSAFRVAVLNQKILEKWGITEQFLVRFYALIEESETKLFETGSVKSNRNETTVRRTKMSNKIYQTLQQMWPGASPIDAGLADLMRVTRV